MGPSGGVLIFRWWTFVTPGDKSNELGHGRVEQETWVKGEFLNHWWVNCLPMRCSSILIAPF